MANKPDVLLWLSDARGQYTPRDFATSFSDRAKDVSGVSQEQWGILEDGPTGSNESYWDVWLEVCECAVITDGKKNIKYRVHQDGDCWLVPEGMAWDDDKGFHWPEEETEAAE